MFEVTKNPEGERPSNVGRPRLPIPFEKLTEKDDSFLVPTGFAKPDSIKMATWRYAKANGIILRTNKEEGGIRITRR